MLFDAHANERAPQSAVFVIAFVDGHRQRKRVCADGNRYKNLEVVESNSPECKLRGRCCSPQICTERTADSLWVLSCRYNLFAHLREADV